MSNQQPPAVSDDVAKLDAARKIARKLLKALGVTKVIVVDDQAVPGPELLISVWRDNPKRAPVPQDRGWDELDPSEWAAQVRSWFESEQDDDQRRELHRRALKKLEHEVRSLDLDVLQQLIGPDKTTMLLPNEWRDNGIQLIQDAGGPAKALVLFDLNLGMSSPRGGFELMRGYLQTHDDAKAAIFTDQATPDQELDEVHRLTENCTEIRPRTLLASKENLTAAGAERFLNVLRLTASAPAIVRIRDEFLARFAEHHDIACERLVEIPPRVLEDIVFRSSHEEGAWELDTMLRLIALFHHEAMRNDLKSTAGPHGLQALLSDARVLVDACFLAHPPSLAVARNIMSSERWPLIGYVNELGLPLANGDVFEIDDRNYILMCQPCDLILRKTGRRKARWSVTLLGLSTSEIQAAEGEEAGQTPTLAEPVAEANRHHHGLPPGFGDTVSGPVMTFSPWYDVDPFVLDLCTFDPDGRARIDTSAPPRIAALTDGISARRDDIVKGVKARLKMIHDCAELPDDARRRIVRQILAVDPAHLISYVPQATGTQRLAYACKRVGRLAAPYADAALTALSAERAREAHEHDLDSLGDRARLSA